MSRVAATKSSPVATSKRDARVGSGAATGGAATTNNGIVDSIQPDDRCPVCRSSRYLNASLRFLVNPECYHKMCESCVDRIFSHGPAPCPIRNCGKTLRKHRFREQTFEDIKVEREVDIRRRVAAVFNRREDDFEDVRAYNDYLNEVEDITFNLVEGIDVPATEARFAAYRDAHEKEISANASLAEQERVDLAARQKLERDQARRRRDAARREEVEERREVQENRRDMLARLAAGQDAEQVAKEGQQVTLKKRMDRQAATERQRQLQAASSTRNGGPAASASGGGGVDGREKTVVIKGLRAKRKPEPEKAIDPFGGLSYEGRKYFALQDHYEWIGVRETESDPLVRAGGYDVAAFTGRALCEAFAGLGVFLADENREAEEKGQNALAVGTARAEVAARDVKMEDPF